MSPLSVATFDPLALILMLAGLALLYYLLLDEEARLHG